MPEPDLIDLFVVLLNQAGIRYFVSGSIAAMLYGEPRVTHDIDVKLEYHREGGSEKRLRDIRAVLEVSGEQLDYPALSDWMERLDLKTE